MSAVPNPTMTPPASSGPARAAPVFGFGSFRLLPAQRLLLEGESPVPLGSRAFDLLVALVERAGQVLSKQELLAAAWPGRVVEDNTLRVHIAALRRTLKRARCGVDSEGGGSDGDCIVNVPGRGYCLVAPVWRITGLPSIEAMMERAGLVLRERPGGVPPPLELEPPLAEAETSTSTSVETMLAALQQQFTEAFSRGEHDLMLKASEQLSALARDTARPQSTRLADRMRAQSYHYMGRHREAAALASGLLADKASRKEAGALPDAASPEVALGIVLARLDWLEGRPAQAQAGMTETLALAAREHPLALAEALALGALPLALWRGDALQAGQLLARLAELSREPGCGRRFQPWVESLGMLLDRSLEGFTRLASLLKSLGAEQAKLADHLVSFDARLVTEHALQRVLKCQTGWCAPEILRARAEQLIKTQQPLRALRLLDDSVALARAQGSLAWELRSAISRAQLRAPQSLRELAAIVRRFGAGESGADADLRTARRLLESQSVSG